MYFCFRNSWLVILYACRSAYRNMYMYADGIAFGLLDLSTGSRPLDLHVRTVCTYLFASRPDTSLRHRPASAAKRLIFSCQSTA